VRPDLISLHPPTEEERTWAEELAREEGRRQENDALSTEEPRARP
jgi:hypothetical protein